MKIRGLALFTLTIFGLSCSILANSQQDLNSQDCVNLLLTANGNVLQEQIWSASEKGELSKAEGLDSKLKKFLEESPISKVTSFHEEDLETGSGEIFLVTFTNGIKAVFKPSPRHWKEKFVQAHHSNQDPKREVAAWTVDRLFGFNLVPVTVIRKIGKSTGSLQLWIDSDDSEISDQMSLRKNIFYYLIAAHDKDRPGNELVRNKRAIAIDNAISFENGGGFSYVSSPPNMQDFYFDDEVPEDIEQKKMVLNILANLKKPNNSQIKKTLRSLISPEEIDDLIARWDEFVYTFNEN